MTADEADEAADEAALAIRSRMVFILLTSVLLPVSSRHNYCPILRRMLNAATWLIAFLAAAAHTSAVAELVE